jgi:hypothetical protein
MTSHLDCRPVTFQKSTWPPMVGRCRFPCLRIVMRIAREWRCRFPRVLERSPILVDRRTPGFLRRQLAADQGQAITGYRIRINGLS